MSAYADRFKQKADQIPTLSRCLEGLLKSCPNVHDMLFGAYDAEGQELVKGSSITFFMDGNRLKFVVRPKSHGEVGWGVIKDPLKPWDSIELALMSEEIDWKESKFTSPESTPY